jgi:hypothetical protein
LLQCEACSKSFAKLGRLRRHMTVAHQHNAPAQLLSCDLCARQFHSRNGLRRHWLQQHMAVAEPPPPPLLPE